MKAKGRVFENCQLHKKLILSGTKAKRLNFQEVFKLTKTTCTGEDRLY